VSGADGAARRTSLSNSAQFRCPEGAWGLHSHSQGRVCLHTVSLRQAVLGARRGRESEPDASESCLRSILTCRDFSDDGIEGSTVASWDG
jgi:hypothetical protein